MNTRCLAILAAVLSVSAGCGHHAEQKSLTDLKAAPDIVAKAAEPSSRWRAFNLRAFQVNHIWGADGYAPSGDKWANYRAKITLWDNDPKAGGTAIAEIFFRDPEQLDNPEARKNPDPNAQGPGRTYRLNFPSNTLEGVLQTLRFANSDVYLYYYDEQWAIGTDSAEAIGSN